MELHLNIDIRKTLLADVKSLVKDLGSLQQKLENEVPSLTDRDISALKGVLEGKRQLVLHNVRNLDAYSEEEQSKFRSHYVLLIEEIDNLIAIL